MSLFNLSSTILAALESRIASLETSTSNIETDVLALSDQVDFIGWSDLIAPLSNAKGSGATQPTFQDMGNGIFGQNFGTGDKLYATFHVLHDYLPNSVMYPHVHFCISTSGSAGKTVTWTIDYIVAKGHSQNDSLTTATSTITLTYVFDGTELAGEHIVLEDDTQFIPATNLEPDAIINTVLTLSASSLGGAVAIYGLQLDMHYQAQYNTTLNKEPNFYA